MTIRTTIPVPKIEDDCYDWYARHEAKVSEAAVGNHDIVLIGDSITHFWEPGEPTHGDNTWSEFFNGRRVMNLGFGYDRTQNVLWRLEHGEFAGQTPKLVVIHIGTNNLGGTVNCPADTPEDVAKGIAAIVHKVHALSPESTILAMEVFPRGDGKDRFAALTVQTSQALRRELGGLDFVRLLDLAPELGRSGGGIRSDCTRDGCHLNGAGYRIWGRALSPWLHW